MVDVFSVNSPDVAEDVLRGLREGIEKFGVPIIGGHFHPDTPYSALDVAILGKAKKGAVIFSSGAKPGNSVVVGVDLDGRVHPSFAINWDTTSFKDGKVLLRQLGSMRELGERGLVTAGKDISNPGMLGTLGMLLESSRAGAVVDLDLLPRPPGMDMATWQKMYPGMGFVVTTQPEKAEEVAGLFRDRGLSSAVVGTVTKERRLVIASGKERAVLFDFEQEIITGIR